MISAPASTAAARLRSEPFRLFFPLALALGWAGVLPWVLSAGGVLGRWPGTAHAHLMTQGFLTALSVGFLGTMLPRRLRCAPLGGGALALLCAALAALPAALLAGHLCLAQLLFGAVLLVLVGYALTSLRRGGGRPPLPSFLWLPAALGLGALGALLTFAGAAGLAPPWALALGQRLGQQGLLLGLVLGLAPMLSAILATGEGPAEPPPPEAARLRALHGAGVALLLGSFVLEVLWAPGPGLLLRAALCAVALSSSLRHRGVRPGLHRRLFPLALGLVPLGLAGAGLVPAHRVALLHLCFVGGLSLLSLAVSVHVGLLHTGHEALAARRPPLVALAAALMLAAMAVRAGADLGGARYLTLLGVAASLWLLSALAWALFLVPKLLRAPRPEAA